MADAVPLYARCGVFLEYRMTEARNSATDTVLAALAAAGDVAYVWNVQTDALKWHGALDGLKFFDAIATGRAFARLIHPDDLPLRDQRFVAHAARGEIFDCEYRVRLPGGGYAWFHDRGTAKLGRDGRPERLLGVLRLITSRKAAEQKLEQLANYDELTGHFNKKRLRESLDQIIAGSLRSGEPGAFLAVGIDKLATINDAYGYRAADNVIIEIGQRLDRCLRVSDVIGRVNGDRFGIILGNCAEQNIATAAEKILSTVSQVPIDTVAGPVYATVSIGSATFPEQAKTPYELMAHADTALAEAKRAGRDCYVPYRLSEEQRRRHRAGLALGERVQRALKEGRLVFAYQPVVSAATGAVDYNEALLRMIGEDGALIPAGDFVAAIEQLGFIRLIDRYVLEKAVEEVAQHPGLWLGFNISGLTATDRQWLRAVTVMLKERPEVASRLVVEITETAALHDIAESARFVRALRELGCRVALDDFGAGFTSLRHLQQLQVDTVKIDGSFVRHLTQNPENQIFLRHLIGLAKGLNLSTVAEWVENADEAAILRREGVECLQGYFFGAPTLEKPWRKAQGANETLISGIAS
jgi:diguanylate cyclase (GGDEF)-like protein